jgi:hypothetical protein
MVLGKLWGFFWPGSAVPQEELQRLQKKSKAISTALERCRRANVDNPGACNNLDTSLVTSYAEELCRPDFEEHKRCYSALLNTGGYNGLRDCDASVAAMQQCLRKRGVYPIKTQ